MSLFKDLLDANDLTEREGSIRDFLLNHPERLASMSCRHLAAETYTSAATVSRFCRKMGCEGFPDFKVRFLSDLRGGVTPSEQEEVQLSQRENIVSLIQKASEVQDQALAATRDALSLSQMMRIQKHLVSHTYVDFYAYDINLHLAHYASSLFFHAGKVAATYSESNIQVLGALNAQPGHVAIVISHTGENQRLIELGRLLKAHQNKLIVITSGKNTTLGTMADEFLYAPITESIDRMWTCTFFVGAKYLLDLMYAITFCSDYGHNMSLNYRYETIGEATFWNLVPGKPTNGKG